MPGVQAFLAIVQTGSLSKAAEQLNLTQGAVSYRLKILEQTMGARLVERSKGLHQIELTPMGESFLSLAERWNRLQQETQILQAAGPQLSLAVSAADSLNLYVLPPLYQALRSHRPALRIRVRTQHTAESFESVERKELVVAYVVREASASASIAVEPFFSEEMVLMRLAGADRSTGDTVAIDSLDGRQELYMNWSANYRSWHDRWWDPLGPARTHLDTAALIVALMNHADQWAVVPQSVGSHFAAGGRFVVQQLSVPAPPRTCFKVTHKYPSQRTRESLRLLAHYEKLCGLSPGGATLNP